LLALTAKHRVEIEASRSAARFRRSRVKGETPMKTRTNLKAGGMYKNHNETVVRDRRRRTS